MSNETRYHIDKRNKKTAKIKKTGLYFLKTFNSKENQSIAIENIHYVYDHKHLYRSALRPVINDFLVTKRTTYIDNKKNSIEICEKTLS